MLTFRIKQFVKLHLRVLTANFLALRLFIAGGFLDVGPLGDLHCLATGLHLQAAGREQLLVVHIEIDLTNERFVLVGEILRAGNLTARPLHLVGDADVARPAGRSFVGAPVVEERFCDDKRALGRCEVGFERVQLHADGVKRALDVLVARIEIVGIERRFARPEREADIGGFLVADVLAHRLDLE